MDVIERWDLIFQTRDWGRYPDTSVVRFIGRNYFSVPDRSKVNILEIGPGPGANLWFLAKENFKVWGVEGSETAVNKCIERITEERCEEQIGAIVAGDFNKIPFENDFFDAVIDIEALSCNDFESSKGIIRSAIRKLKRGGKLFSLTFSEKCSYEGEEVSQSYFKINGDSFSGMGNIRFTKENEIEELYLEKGVRINSIERYDRILTDESVISEWAIEVEKL